MIIYLEIRTYRGISFGIHYYGELVEPRDENGFRKRVSLTKKLSISAAAALNKRDGQKTYKPGDETFRFSTKDEIMRLALATYKEHFPEAMVLILGEHYVAEPQKILDGPADVKDTINKLVDKAEAIGWWSNPGMHDICDEWQRIFEAFLIS